MQLLVSIVLLYFSWDFWPHFFSQLHIFKNHQTLIILFQKCFSNSFIVFLWKTQAVHTDSSYFNLIFYNNHCPQLVAFGHSILTYIAFRNMPVDLISWQQYVCKSGLGLRLLENSLKHGAEIQMMCALVRAAFFLFLQFHVSGGVSWWNISAE